MEALQQNGLKTPNDFHYLDYSVIQEMKYLSPITKAKLRKLANHLSYQAAESPQGGSSTPQSPTGITPWGRGSSPPYPNPGPPLLYSTPTAHPSQDLLCEPSPTGASTGGTWGGGGYARHLTPRGVASSVVSSSPRPEQRHSFAATTAAAVIAAGISIY
jgi:hypothetical protein